MSVFLMGMYNKSCDKFLLSSAAMVMIWLGVAL